MKLVISIVHRDDADGLITALLKKDYRATRISTTGGFLREGNATILVGTEDHKVQEVLSLIKANCRTRTQLIAHLPWMDYMERIVASTPFEVQVGGATVFVIEVAEFWRF